MFRNRDIGTPCRCVLAALWLGVVGTLRADEPPRHASPEPLRIATAGNSFINWVPAVLREVESQASVARHDLVARSFIGGSRVVDHWQVPDEGSAARAALTAGTVDVLMLGGRLAPDEGIGTFVAPGLDHQPRLRVTLQEGWLPFDRLDRFPDGVLQRLAWEAVTGHRWSGVTAAP